MRLCCFTLNCYGHFCSNHSIRHLLSISSAVKVISTPGKFIKKNWDRKPKDGGIFRDLAAARANSSETHQRRKKIYFSVYGTAKIVQLVTASA